MTHVLTDTEIRRLKEISRCMNELEILEKVRIEHSTFIDKFNNLWGEMDWLEELHRLLYDYE